MCIRDSYKTEILVNELSLLGTPGGGSKSSNTPSTPDAADYADQGICDADIPF